MGYYIIITGFLNKKAIRKLKECLLNDVNKTHPHLYKNVTAAIANLDKKVEDKKKKQPHPVMISNADDDGDSNPDLKLHPIIQNVDEFLSKYCKFKQEKCEQYAAMFLEDKQFKLEWLKNHVFDDEALQNIGIQNRNHRKIILTEA